MKGDDKFVGSGSMSIAIGAGAIGSQVNNIVQQTANGRGSTIVAIAGTGREVSIADTQRQSKHSDAVVTISEDDTGRTIVSQQVRGYNNVFSGTGPITINGAEAREGESVTVIDGHTFINRVNKPNGEGTETAEDHTVRDTIVGRIRAEVQRLHGSDGQEFLDTLDLLVRRPSSKWRQDAVTEEFTALRLHESPVIVSLFSELARSIDSARDQWKTRAEKLHKETAFYDTRIQKAYSALVGIIDAEIDKESPASYLMERAIASIKVLIDQPE